MFPTRQKTSAHAIAPCLSLTHPERCATKLCAGKYKQFFRISNLRPNRDQNVVPEWTKMRYEGRSHPATPSKKKVRPALRKAGRSYSKSVPFLFKSQPWHTRRVEKCMETCPSEKSATHLAQGRSHFSKSTPKN